ncbi:ABC-type nitrate/sulfonate/bicarbonate transport system, ATPase component [Clostridium pasteurianum DSM 525 = ATCC 6013]|uniref:ABC-type nitrate/sulfonate/bicarbonate transport system, ATPase component n=1 Tax=Clostridium pasteurianum DSM 525 = ATCC 6013 TaxID=1262449 RepID=A0A0H3J2E2_CLOPA|nr:ABC transporter ATP-binding protein [Clostridium pasteurianum]AJA47599.1 ABC-type nitrate/sulfonate/bicarbonate transport system, ATPase component [Clostridium pasteurianum DSM 525 = ATCC 6013]AJA51587.1 ABC-type nitrate/sulfonate/bicarbonate transport system, ATPase component [Clostridium pasteurianum DSM 525 = ATCC 6013]AOZ74912.1 spermidine/putrescine ABC transporter ATP-binding protein [Clostridium pasteurianum DSM 525 = ATCC 6013]AOZ78707.1 spermidine/putrescine ABC transporter ATP-bind
MNKIDIQHIFVNYHSMKSETEAIKDISFKLKKGEFLSVVGPSGCGKSTLLNVICGLIKPSKGHIFMDGKEIKGLTTKIGYMFQRDHLFEWLTVWDNVCIGLKVQHKLTKENKDKLEDLLVHYGLEDFKNYHPSELSGGMRQRVALIRTLALDPEVLLLDEPFSALDYQSRLKASDEIFKIIKQENKTAIMVTHDISEAISMSGRVIVLSNRPARIKKDIAIDFQDDSLTPLNRREHPKFRYYFDSIWKEFDLNDSGK